MSPTSGGRLGPPSAFEPGEEGFGHDPTHRDLQRHLDGWLADAEASEALVMRRFAAGLKKDLPAVRAGLTERRSNGPVEGFVHKLKLLKRQGYGRANFDLLRTRMLAV